MTLEFVLTTFSFQPSPKWLAISPSSNILAWPFSILLLDTLFLQLLDRNSLNFYAKRQLTSSTMVVFNQKNIFKLLLDLVFLSYLWPVDFKFENLKLQNNIITQLRKKNRKTFFSSLKKIKVNTFKIIYKPRKTIIRRIIQFIWK